jgi:hypothetical protein
MTAKNCLACERPIKGRTDKKFCDDSCRNNYNNRLNSDASPLIRNINNILRKNRRILAELLSGLNKPVLVIDRPKLVAKGYKFEYFTEHYSTKENEKYYYCYDYGYRQLDEEKLMVVKDTRKKTFYKEEKPLMAQRVG